MKSSSTFAMGLVVASMIASGPAAVFDDFSSGDWERSESTPGTLEAAAGSLRLVDAAGSPEWITASRVHRVNFDENPIFIVKVRSVSSTGLVKLIRLKPQDKREVLRIDRPGL